MHVQDAREDLDLTADSALSELASKTGATEFTGYEELRLDSVAVLQLLKGGVGVNACSEGDAVDVVLARTPFYAESGGQVGDIGILEVRLIYTSFHAVTWRLSGPRVCGPRAHPAQRS
jgi:alanyl-tRNA synthetase